MSDLALLVGMRHCLQMNGDDVNNNNKIYTYGTCWRVITITSLSNVSRWPSHLYRGGDPTNTISGRALKKKKKRNQESGRSVHVPSGRRFTRWSFGSGTSWTKPRPSPAEPGLRRAKQGSDPGLQQGLSCVRGACIRRCCWRRQGPSCSGEQTGF